PCGAEFATGFGSRSEFEPCLSREPFICVRVQFHQLAFARFCQIKEDRTHPGCRFRRLAETICGAPSNRRGAGYSSRDGCAPLTFILYFVNAPAGAMDAAVFVTFARIAPVEHEHAAVGAVTEFHAAEPGVCRNEEVRPV